MFICWLDKQLIWNQHPVTAADTDHGMESETVQNFAVCQPVPVELRPTSTGKSAVQLGGNALRRTAYR